MTNPIPNILIGTPAYAGMLHTNYLNSILSFTSQKQFQFGVMTLNNESLIPRGRNTIITYFHNMPQFTHLLFLDADIFVHGQDIIKLLNHNKDVIGAPVALKGYNDKNEKVYNIGKLIEQVTSNLYEIDKIGTAVFMLSRKAVSTLVDTAILNNDYYVSNKDTRVITDAEIKKDDKIYDIFKVNVIDHVYQSEDFYVCNKLRELNYKIYTDDSIITRHAGTIEF